MGDPVYFDTSALAKLVLNEPESSEMARFVDGLAGQPVSSELSELELLRAVLRQHPDGLDTALEVLARLVMLPMTESIRLRAAYLAPTSLGSLDAFHLATALEIQVDLETIVSYDNRLCEAARDHAIDTVSPGASD